MWLDLHTLFTPKLGLFKFTQSFFSSLTRPTSHYKYNEWLYKIEIGIHYVYSSKHPDFWVMDDDNFSSTSLLLHYTNIKYVCTNWNYWQLLGLVFILITTYWSLCRAWSQFQFHTNFSHQHWVCLYQFDDWNSGRWERLVVNDWQDACGWWWWTNRVVIDIVGKWVKNQCQTWSI